MLAALELQDFAIIDSLRLDFATGFNVLSGETGAGKSILIDALSLLRGGRSDSSFVRSGAKSALIQGLFSGAPHDSIARRIQRQGRSSARLDGELITIGELGTVASQQLAIHGQHASQNLLETAEQRKLLDRLLDDDAQQTLCYYQRGYAEYQSLCQALEERRQAQRHRAQRLDVLQFQLAEIDAAALQADEEDQLRSEQGGLQHAERIVSASGRCLALLSDDDVNVHDLLAKALNDLENAGRYHPEVAALAKDLADSLSGVQAVSEELSSFLLDFEVNPARLEQLEARLQQIERLKRKYGDSIAAILQSRAQMAEELEQLETIEDSISNQQQQIQALEQRLHEQARSLSQARQRTAQQLSQAVCQHLHSLGMPKARIEIEVSASDSLQAHGCDQVRFLFSANLGEALAPLSDVASGGELSRLMLAVNVVTGSDVATLIFDEVDAGIGGQTARAVGALLQRLAVGRQVLVVTHLAQVAAFADAHFYVEKLEQNGRTVTSVRRLDAAEREAELARMLSGSVTDTALAHARELLSNPAASL